MPTKKKEIKVADLKPAKDATGGRSAAALKIKPKANKIGGVKKSGK